MPIKLNKEDLRWAHWRNIPADPRPKSKSFSLADCLRQLQALPLGKAYPYKIIWSKLKINIGMSREEAHFWIEAIYKASENRVILMPELIEYMSRPEAVYDGRIGLDRLTINLKPYLNAENFLPGIHIIPAFVLLTIKDFVQFLSERIKLFYRTELIEEAFRIHILPYLSPEEKAVLREGMRQHIQDFMSNRKSPYTSGYFAIAGLIGDMDSELGDYLNLYASGKFPTVVRFHDYVRYAAFGLSTRDKVEAAIRDNELVVYKQFIRAWLAHTELDGLDWLTSSIPGLRYSSAQKQVFKSLTKPAYREAVLPVLSLCENQKFGAEALKWLDENPVLAAETLVPLAFSQPQAEQIQNYLRRMSSSPELEASIRKLDAAGQARFRSEILEKP